jgi:hypothetical protein
MGLRRQALFSRNAGKTSSVAIVIAEALAEVEMLDFVKIYPQRLLASNLLSTDGKKRPVIEIGNPSVVGVELLIDPGRNVVQFYSIASAVKGVGGMIVDQVMNATQLDW